MLSIPNVSPKMWWEARLQDGNEITFMHFVVVLVSCLDWLKLLKVVIEVIVCSTEKQIRFVVTRGGGGGLGRWQGNWMKAVRRYKLPVKTNRY